VTFGESVFVIAEGACNHMCDIELAYRMIDEAANSGADAIKFQTYKAEELVSSRARAFWGQEKISQQEYYRALDKFNKADYRQLFEHARRRGIICFSSPFDFESVDILAELNMPIFKIASCDIDNLPLIEHIAKVGKPIILSTGASTAEEVDRAFSVIRKVDQELEVALLACTLSYPTDPKNGNLARIRTLQKLYPSLTIGLSDHTEPDSNMVIPAVAVGVGAQIIEKHFTLDRSMTGSGHFFAVDPAQLEKMVVNIRLAELVKGVAELGVTDAENRARMSARRSIVARRDLNAGVVLDESAIAFKRPAGGLAPSQISAVLGKKLVRAVFSDEQILEEMLLPESEIEQ